jgi:WXXGXW repeat (2 copies)
MKKLKSALILLLAVAFMAIKADAQVSVSFTIGVAPPVIPVYVQPACPTDGYLWVPGYWGYGDDGYYWVPGYWASPPEAGYLWTPGYYGYSGGFYGWHGGYWGSHIGFYGGVNYGFGYGGSGYGGGNWVGGRFRYNTAVTNVNTTIVHNTYIDRTVINNTTVNRVSYNGGPGGVQARPSAQEQVAMNEHHVAPTQEQTQHQSFAAHDRTALASVNHGRPATAAVARPMTSVPHATTMNRPGTNAANMSHTAGTNHTAVPSNHAAAPVNHTGAPVNHTAAPSNHVQPQANHTQQVHTVNRSQPVHTVNRPQPVHQAQPRPAAHPAAPREGGGGEERHHR